MKQIKIIPPQKKVYLIGNPNNFKEKQLRDKEDEKLDSYPESEIVYSDLVFTLQHNPHAYQRPCVKKEGDNLVVISNIVSYRAVKEAGINKIHFDLLLNIPLALEQLLEKHNLEFAPPPIQKEYCQRFLFFTRTPNEAETNNQNILLDPRNNTPKFREHNCIAYKALIPSFNQKDEEKFLKTLNENRAIHQDLIARLFNENGYLRSIDGYKSKAGSLGKYIK